MTPRVLALSLLLALLPQVASAKVRATWRCTDEATGEQKVCQVEFLSGDEVKEEVRPISPLLVEAFHSGILYVKVEDELAGFRLLETQVPAPAVVTAVPTGDALQGQDEDEDTWTLRPLP